MRRDGIIKLDFGIMGGRQVLRGISNATYEDFVKELGMFLRVFCRDEDSQLLQSLFERKIFSAVICENVFL